MNEAAATALDNADAAHLRGDIEWEHFWITCCLDWLDLPEEEQGV